MTRRANTHTAEWWEQFWSKPEQHFGTARRGLLDKATRFRDTVDLERPLTAVDAGSGNGRYALELAKLGFSTTAIEKSANGCQIISQRAQAAGLDISIRQDDFLDIYARIVDGDQERFDVVLSSGLIEEVDRTDQEKIIKGLQALTKPGGLLIFKFCLEISSLGITVDDGYVFPFFDNHEWIVLEHDSESALRDALARPNQLRTETIIARKIGDLA